MTPAEKVMDLHVCSGLSWAEIGRAVGVGRRAVHGWAHGTRMNTSNLASINELVAEVDALRGLAPDLVREALYDSSVGESVINRMMRKQHEGRVNISGPLPVAFLLGIAQD